jgi:hypothetical protein
LISDRTAPGINSHSIAAIVGQELVPVEPDLVVFYEGANQFWPETVVSLVDPRDAARRPAIPRSVAVATAYSATARRVERLAERHSAGDGSEPAKPRTAVHWPADVDERDPAVNSPHLPMDLPAVLRDLDAMRNALAGIHAELVMSSFIWIVRDGMPLDVDRDFTLYDYLNRTYWPFTYAQMRRMADFQNRVFEAYARVHHLPFIDVAAQFPIDPALTGDAIHLRYQGLALQAWMFLQHLIPIVEERVADGRLPRAPATTGARHPAFDQPSRLTTFADLRAGCHQ